MAEYIPVELRRQVAKRDRDRCAYCQTSEANSGIPLSIDHIIPVADGGQTTLENLCSNSRGFAQTVTIDGSSRLVALRSSGAIAVRLTGSRIDRTSWVK